MAKQKEETKTENVDPQVFALQQELEKKNLKLAQIEQELQAIKQDPFQSREGWHTFSEKNYELLWIASKMLGSGGTAWQIQKQLEAFEKWYGPEWIQAKELEYRGIKPKK